MKILVIILGVWLLPDTLAQGFVPQLQPESSRRALTPLQQTHILSDVQQHHNRFSFPHNQIVSQHKSVKTANVFIEPAIQQQLPTQTTIIHHRNQQSQNEQQRFQPLPPFDHQNKFRSNANNDLHIQHHTQTNFIPNYVQQQQQQQQPQSPQPHQHQHQQQRQHQNQQFEQPRTNQFAPSQNFERNNQLQLAVPHPNQQPSPIFHQQPLHQRSVHTEFQQKPFQPSQQLSPLEPLVSTPNTPEHTFLQQLNFIPQPQVPVLPQQPTTLQNHLFNSPNSQHQFPQTEFQRPQQFFPPQFQQPKAIDFPSQQISTHQQQPQQHFPSYQQQQQLFRDQREEAERLREKELLIQKHEQFVQKQYQKQQTKVKQQHEDFLSKQRRIKDQSISANRPSAVIPSFSKSRTVYPFEANVFQRALNNYYEANPTQPPTTTTTTTTEATTLKRVASTSVRPQKAKRLRGKSELSDDDLEQFLKNHRQKLYGELKIQTENQQKVSKTKSKTNKPLGRDDLLKQLKLALAEAPQEPGNDSYAAMDLVLPGGQKVQVIRTSDPNIIKNAGNSEFLSQIAAEKLVASPSTEKPQVLYDDLSKGGFLPPGAEFEVIKQSADGGLQPVEKLPNQKKVTFVYLEEQDDGSYKVQGVKSNGEKEAKTKGVEVENIIKRINNGDIQLPPPSKKVGIPSKSSTTSTGTSSSSTTYASSSTAFPSSSISDTSYTSAEHESNTASIRYSSPTASPSTIHGIESSTASSASSRYTSPNASPSPVIRFSSSISPYSTLATIPSSNIVQLTASPSSHLPSSHFPSSSPSSYHPSYETSASTTSVPPTSSTFSDTTIPRSSTTYQSSSASYPSTSHRLSSPTHDTTHSKLSFSTSTSHSESTPNHISSTNRHSSTPIYVRTSQIASSTTIFTTEEPLQTGPPQSDLIKILKDAHLHAMAKYLKQSGLDSILNETGPYTVFAPTDKAFRNLMVQLGGPERAEEKFRTNPRLLSGLLLHHVIPGSFEIGSLQDEMTGVSLAGTQLRVNQYKMHDAEWNDVKITTINGALVVPDKSDVMIPQGVAHAVDRVMFPLPVGDLLQTLQSDRERRFTLFLRALFASGISELLQNKEDSASGKTYTLFAPTDTAFASLPKEEVEKLISDKEAATKFIMKHITSGTIYSAGMRFYQVKDSLTGGKPITIQKTSTGKIKANDSQIITSNIPATNGVIHAIDLLF